MARSRNIKPGFFENEVLGVQDPFVCLLFAGLWVLADKAGILEDRPMRIKAQLFPYRESLDVNGYLTVLQRLGFINRYEFDKNRYIEVINFKKHQSPHHTERDSNFPCFSDSCTITVSSPLEHGGNPPDSLIHDSLIHDSPIHRRIEKNTTTKKQKPDLPDGFAEFWAAYPRKENKAVAIAAWKKHKPDLATLLAAIRQQSTSEQWQKDGGAYIPHPSTWINKRRWEDEVQPSLTVVSAIKPGQENLTATQRLMRSML